MSDKEGLRSTILQEADTVATKSRFGLFSQPVTTAVGDDGEYKTKIHKRGEDGKPITKPRNLCTSPTKKGQLAYFEPIKTLASSDKKDVFLEEGRRLLREQNQTFSVGRKEASFFTGMGPKTLTNCAFEYVEEKNPEKDPKSVRDADGKVKCKPRNFYTNTNSKVDRELFKQLKHVEDPYDRFHKSELQYQRKARAAEGQAAFKPNSFVPKLLNTERKLREEDIPLEKKPAKQTKFNIYPHETTFKYASPMKKGHKGFLEPFPTYMENPPKELQRIDHKPNERGHFRSMSVSLSRPSPSVTGLSVKKSICSMIRRR